MICRQEQVDSMKIKKDASNQNWWWIAISGASSPVDSRHAPTVSPIPEQLIGYSTQLEQLAPQRLILREPMEQVNEYLEGLPSRFIRASCVMSDLLSPRRPRMGKRTGFSRATRVFKMFFQNKLRIRQQRQHF